MNEHEVNKESKKTLAKTMLLAVCLLLEIILCYIVDLMTRGNMIVFFSLTALAIFVLFLNLPDFYNRELGVEKFERMV